MDMFGDDDDETQGSSDISLVNIFNDVLIFLMKFKSSLKASNISNSSNGIIHEVIVSWSILLVYDITHIDNQIRNAYESLMNSLGKVNYSVIAVNELQADSVSKKFDIIVDLNRIPDNNEENYFKLLNLVTRKNAIWIGLKNMWDHINATDGHWLTCDKYHRSDSISALQKSSIRINTRGCIYWTGKLGYNLRREYENLDKVVIPISEEERTCLIFSDTTHTRALKCLDQYGICIFPGLFDELSVNMWGDAVKQDMTDALDALRLQGVDIFTPGQQIENYYEMSMREALRIDLRNGKHIKELSSTCPQRFDIRSHPAIRRLMSEAMNAVEGKYASGNWGMWNFEGKGPSIPRDQRPIVIGHVGAVISFPGCADQTIHADTAHIYTPCHLPGHYFNLFIPASLSDDIRLGQTAFILSSHHLETSADIMVGERGQELLESLLIRPHLSLGDALIFDCRILHFGLANQSSMEDPGANTVINSPQPRIMIYINHHQPWFQDPKNWNDRNKLFPVGNS